MAHAILAVDANQLVDEFRSVSVADARQTRVVGELPVDLLARQSFVGEEGLEDLELKLKVKGVSGGAEEIVGIRTIPTLHFESNVLSL